MKLAELAGKWLVLFLLLCSRKSQTRADANFNCCSCSPADLAGSTSDGCSAKSEHNNAYYEEKRLVILSLEMDG